MNYEKKYKEALGWMQSVYPTMTGADKEDAEHYFPELKSEDERIREALMQNLKERFGTKGNMGKGLDMPDVLAWLEKQGEQKHWDSVEPVSEEDKFYLMPCEHKPADKAEPKFKVGKWYQCIKDFFGKGVTFYKNTAYYCAKEGCLQNEYGCHIAIVKDLYDNFKLWTIADAKDGDLIYVSTEKKGAHAIFHEYKNFTIFFHCYSCGDFVQGGYMPIGIIELVRPLQKTHYNRFFEKMHEAGYEWDAEKKELRKIEPKPAWSEEDVKKVNNLYVLLDQMVSFNMLSNKDATEFKGWLKSLKEMRLEAE